MRREADEREELLREWTPFLLAITRSVCAHAQDVDDALQEARLIFLEVHPRFPGGNIRGWMTVVVRRRLYSWFSQQRRHRQVEVLTDDFDHSASIEPDIAVDAIDRIARDDLLAHLSPEFQQAVRLCLVEGLQQTRAADAAGLPTNTMKSRLDRATKQLRKLMAQMPKDA